MQHTFCRKLYAAAKTSALKYVSLETLRTAWHWKDGMFEGSYEVQIGEGVSDEIPAGLIWYGTACCVWYAKGRAFEMLAEAMERGEVKERLEFSDVRHR